MDHSQKMPTLVYLSQQIQRHDKDIVAIRGNVPVYTTELKSLVTSIYQELMRSPITHWAIYVQDSFNFVASLLALFYAGKHPVLLNSINTQVDQYYQALLTDRESVDNAGHIDHAIININRLAKELIPEIALPDDFQSSALTLFTSGSTGIPKPIIKTVCQLEKESEILTTYFNPSSEHLFVASVTHEHMYGLTFKIMLALLNKLPFVCEPIQYQEQLSLYREHKLFYITTPSMLKMLDTNITNNSCDKVISAAGVLTYQEAHLSLQCLNVLPNEIYGSTETGIIATRVQNKENMPWQLFPQMQLKKQAQQSILISPLLSEEERLNDKIEITHSNMFYLNGRLDKIVKIAEQRVSLTYIEEQLDHLPEVITSKVIVLTQKNRTSLGAVIQLSENGKKKLQQLGHFNLSQYFRHGLKDKLPLVAIPKKWRFLEQMPINNQGKLTYIELNALFNQPEPIMDKKQPNELNITSSAHHADIILQVPNDLFWFEGHFPSRPILPGVVQLNWVTYYSQKILKIPTNILSIDVIKFQIPILPNDILHLRITLNDELNKLQFSYCIGDKTASSGKLTLCP